MEIPLTLVRHSSKSEGGKAQSTTKRQRREYLSTKVHKARQEVTAKGQRTQNFYIQFKNNTDVILNETQCSEESIHDTGIV
jgi:hypothetical protein